MERKIRELKSRLLAKQTEINGIAETDVKAILQKDYDKLAYDLRTKNQKYNDFLKEHDFKKEYERTKVGGFDRKQSAQANGAATRWKNQKEKAEKPLKNSAGQDIIEVSKTKVTATPNSITQVTNAKGGKDRNFYGNDGRQILQISNHGHGHKKEEQFGKHGEHAHDYTWDSDGKAQRSRGRELRNDERSDNDDFL